eukprot:5778151-Pyramimonas_sp.AAC.1
MPALRTESKTRPCSKRARGSALKGANRADLGRDAGLRRDDAGPTSPAAPQGPMTAPQTEYTRRG